MSLVNFDSQLLILYSTDLRHVWRAIFVPADVTADSLDPWWYTIQVSRDGSIRASDRQAVEERSKDLESIYVLSEHLRPQSYQRTWKSIGHAFRMRGMLGVLVWYGPLLSICSRDSYEKVRRILRSRPDTRIFADKFGVKLHLLSEAI